MSATSHFSFRTLAFYVFRDPSFFFAHLCDLAPLRQKSPLAAFFPTYSLKPHASSLAQPAGQLSNVLDPNLQNYPDAIPRSPAEQRSISIEPSSMPAHSCATSTIQPTPLKAILRKKPAARFYGFATLTRSVSEEKTSPTRKRGKHLPPVAWDCSP